MDIKEENLSGSDGKAHTGVKNRGGILAAFTGLVFALTVMAVSVGATMTATPSAVDSELLTEATPAAERVDYYLPYPGILPDNPLYKLKMVRDRIRLWMTYGESDKAGKELALADKRISAAAALAEGNKHELAVTTATKAEKYLELSVNRVIKLIASGKDEKSRLLELEKAIAKHGEILAEITKRSGGGEAAITGESMKLNRLLAERVGQLKLEVIK